MLGRLKLIAVLLVFGVCLGVIGWQKYQLIQQMEYSSAPLPPNVKAEITVSPKNVTIRSQKEGTKVISIPKTEPIVITQDRQEDISIKQPGYVPTLCFLPNLGVALGPNIEPMLGLQWLRLESLGIGTSFNVTPSSCSLSLEKDVLRNGQIGLCYGCDARGGSRLLLKFSLFL